MIKISAVIITFNEERNIQRCISSLHAVADEIVVVDSFSTDKTAEICNSIGVKFFQTKWDGYAKTKNYGNNLAEFDYILSIDADEVLAEALKKEIIEFKNSNNPKDAYRFNRLTNYCGSWIYHCGWYPDTKLRLWNKQRGKWEGNIHEEVIMLKDSTIASFKGDLLHYSYFSIQQHINQANKFTDLTAMEAYRKGKKASIFKIIFSPWVKFIRDYFLKLGFLDGYHGFIICKISAFASLLKYMKLKELHQNNKLQK
ncbi:MAG: glycosyltransferase family 2 protein [Bacteroidetes bacterium]|nr:glycosyltransferase family 2 protein [Bacteroidota bacterium]